MLYSLTCNETIKLHFGSDCGNGQCDRESAVAKNLIWSFVDAGHEFFSASDIFDGFQFANGMKIPKWVLLKLISIYQS